MILSCEDFAFTDCCSSCHEDIDYGYELGEYQPPVKAGQPDQKWNDKLWASLCCGRDRVNPTRDQWAAAIRRHRKRRQAKGWISA